MAYLNRVAFSLAIILYLNKVAFSALFRIYTHDDLFAKLYFPTHNIPLIQPLKEIQVSLAFARDYDENDHHTNGLFAPYWDERAVTPQLIFEFKKNFTKRHVKAKVFASIGDRDPRYPFQIEDGDIEAWVFNAAESLTDIVQKYHLDGIDVYYEHIATAQEDEFVSAIGKLIAKLKEDKAITVASIAPSAALNDNFYVPLYTQFGKSIDTVVYQCHKEVGPVLEPNTFVDRFITEATEKYGGDKLLAGYSAIYKDWDTLSPIVYFIGGLEFLMSNMNPFKVNLAVGTSIWYVAPLSPVSPDECASAALSCPVTAS